MRARRLVRRCRRLTPSTVVAIVWAAIALRRARGSLRVNGFGARLPRAPRLPWHAGHGVHLVLRRLDRTCLERAVVEQAWLVAQGRPADVVIGVALSGGDVRAHAWVDGLADGEATNFREIHRIAPATGHVQRRAG